MNQQTIKNHALALELLGAKVEMSDELITARNGRARVSFWISDKYGLFGWSYAVDGSEGNVYSFQQIRRALGLDLRMKASTLIIRALKKIGMTNRGVHKSFRVYGEYSDSRERIRTIADFYGVNNEVYILRHWDEVKGALDLTDYSFELHECAGVFHYISN